MYNFWCTSETELIALAPKAPWIMEEGQVEGHEQRWKDANTKSLPYLLYKGTSLPVSPLLLLRDSSSPAPCGSSPSQDRRRPGHAGGYWGPFDATQHERLADESGKAMRELKRIGSLGTFHYIDNLGQVLSIPAGS
jgi:hypothetical protein